MTDEYEAEAGYFTELGRGTINDDGSPKTCQAGCKECAVAEKARRKNPDAVRSEKYRDAVHWCPGWEMMDNAPGFDLPDKSPFVSSCAEYTTCEGDESNCEYSRTNCNADGSFRCLRHDFETPRCLDCGKSQNERGVPAICDTWHTVVDAPLRAAPRDEQTEVTLALLTQYRNEGMVDEAAYNVLREHVALLAKPSGHGRTEPEKKD